MPKKVYYYGEKDLQGMRWTARTVDFGVGLSVIAAINELYSAQSLLLDRPDLFHYGVRRLGNLAVHAASRREVEIKCNMKDQSFWLDYSDRIIHEAKTDITLFRVAIKTELDKAHFPDSHLYSYIECARVLLEMSITQFDCIMEKAQQQWGRDYKKDFLEYRLGEESRYWNKMCEELYKGYDIDLNSEHVTSMFNKMCMKFADGAYIDACMAEARKKNPNFLSNVIDVKEERCGKRNQK